MLKKLLTITMVVIGAFTLAGCQPTDDGPTVQEQLEMISEAVAALDVLGETTSDLTLPTVAVHDVEVEWESSDTSVIANDGSVTQPTFIEGNKTVTLTAYLNLGDQTLTKTFNVTVLAAGKTDLDNVILATDALVLNVSGIVSTDITLPAAGQYDTVITWESNMPEIIAADGTVTRPAPGTGNQAVILTATVTLGTESSTKEFEVMVKEDVAVEILTIAELKANSQGDDATIAVNDEIIVQGEVVSLFESSTYKGFFISDGTGFMYVFAGTEPSGLAIGDTVEVRGTLSVYYGMPQVAAPIWEAIEDTFTVPAPVAKTVGDIVGYGNVDIPFENYSELIRIEGSVVAEGDYYYLETPDGRVELNDDSDISLLIEKLGMKVEITALYYSYHSGHGDHQIAFTGQAEDITEVGLSDEEAAFTDKNPMMDPVAVADIVLPTVGVNGTTYANWTSSNTDVFADDGTFVARATETVEVTFTGEVTAGEVTIEASFTVVVPVNMTAAEVNELDLGSYFEVTGVVYTEFSSGFYIHSGGGLLFVYEGDFIDEIQPGDEITIIGSLGQYNGLLQVSVMSYNVDDNSGSNPLPTAVVTTVEGINANAVPKGTFATITGEVILEGSYNNPYIYGANGEKVEVYYKSNQGAVKDLAGSVITLTVVTYQDGIVLYQGTAEEIVVVTEDATTHVWTEADMAQALADGIELPSYTDYDLTLPTGTEMYVGAFSWASDNAALGIDGVIVPVLGSETVVTLTVTVTVGDAVVTRDIMVTVADLSDIPLTVSEAAALYDGDNPVSVTVIGIIAGYDISQNFQLQDPDGFGINSYSGTDLEYEVGTMIKFTGIISDFYGTIQITDWEVIEVISTGNELTVTEVTAADLATNPYDYNGQRVLVDLTYVSIDSFGYVHFTGIEGTEVVIESTWLPFIDSYEVGAVLQVEANVDVPSHYGNVRLCQVDPQFDVVYNVGNVLSVYDGENDLELTVVGVITGFDKDGNFQIQDTEGNGLVSYSSEAITAVVGDMVKLTGTISSYYGDIQIKDWTLVEVISSGNELVVQTVTAADLATNPGDFNGARVMIELTYESSDDYGYAIFTGIDGTSIVINSGAWLPDVDTYEAGTVITVEANVIKVNYYGNVRLGAVVFPAE